MNYLSRKSNMWNPLADLRREMDSVFDNFFTPTLSRNWREFEPVWSPACEVAEEDGHYLMSLDMPGTSKDDIKVEVADNTITVSGERHAKDKMKEGGTWYGERRYGKFVRSFTLPAGIEAQKIEANYQDGVLSLMVPKAESAKPRQIKIGSNAGFFGKLLGDPLKRAEEKSSETKVKIA